LAALSQGACFRAQAPARADAAVQTDAPPPGAGGAAAGLSGSAAALVAAAREEILRLHALNARLLAAQAASPDPAPAPGLRPASAPAPAPPLGAGAAQLPGAERGVLARGLPADASPPAAGDGQALQVALRVSRERAARLEADLGVRPAAGRVF